MKLGTIVILLIGCIGHANAQTDMDTSALRAQVGKMTDALVKQDYRTFITYTYPGVIKLIGGEDAMMSMLQKGLDEDSSKQSVIQSVEVGPVMQMVRAGTEIHCLLAEHIIIKVKDGIIKANAYLLAVSMDKGKRWYFVDAGNLDAENASLVLPHYNTDLKIPQKEQPEFIPLR